MHLLMTMLLFYLEFKIHLFVNICIIIYSLIFAYMNPFLELLDANLFFIHEFVCGYYACL